VCRNGRKVGGGEGKSGAVPSPANTTRQSERAVSERDAKCLPAQDTPTLRGPELLKQTYLCDAANLTNAAFLIRLCAWGEGGTGGVRRGEGGKDGESGGLAVLFSFKVSGKVGGFEGERN